MAQRIFVTLTHTMRKHQPTLKVAHLCWPAQRKYIASDFRFAPFGNWTCVFEDKHFNGPSGPMLHYLPTILCSLALFGENKFFNLANRPMGIETRFLKINLTSRGG